MDVIKGNIFDLLAGRTQYIIPIYQRQYSWDATQYGKLWDDILDMEKENKENHFLGSFVCVVEKSNTFLSKFLIIDGQQRLTTLMLILIALRDSIKDDLNIKNQINRYFLIHENQSGEDKYRLILTDEDKDILISLIEERPIPENRKSKLLEAYQYFKVEIAKSKITYSVLQDSLLKLLIAEIILEKGHDDPQAIFESLNSTGKKLSQSDLIRNLILMGMDTKNQESLYIKLWRPFEELFSNINQEWYMDSFFRDYLTMNMHRIPKIGFVYDEFKNWKINYKFSDNIALCEDLYKLGKIYTDMIFAKHNNEQINGLFKEIKSLNMSVAYPFLMAVMRDYHDGVLNLNDTLEIIQLCISYVLRRSVCEIPTNSLNKTFATMENEIRKDNYLNSVKAFFISRIDYREFPNDKKFGDYFISKDIYHIRNRNYILDRLENYDNKSPINVEKLTIEHIMPQNKNLKDEWKEMLGPNYKEVHDKYLHTIGNLTLTGYNPEMSDNSFDIKMNMKGGFKETAVRLNSYLVKQIMWNEDKINERAKLLLEKAINIWKYPTMTEEEIKPFKQEVNISNESKYSIETYDTNDHTLLLFEELDKRILNLSSEVKREYKKLYVAYKLDTNFTDVVFQEKRLRIAINLKFDEINDPKGICRDVTNLGRWGNGDVELFINTLDDIDDAMEIIKQSFEYYNNEI